MGFFARSAVAPWAIVREGALIVGKSKSKFGYFSKDGLNFVGVRFEGSITTPDPKVIPRFKEKVSLVLKPHSGDSLAKTLQSLKNLITGWGNSYKAMRVQRVYLELDKYVKQEVARYLQASGIRLEGRDRRKQMRFLGVPSLSAMVEHETKLPLKVEAASCSPYRQASHAPAGRRSRDEASR